MVLYVLLTICTIRLSLILVQVETTLRSNGIQPSAQRVAVAEYVLHTHEHPSADLVWKRVRERFPWISRATVYNTLNLFVEKGLLQRLTIAEDSVVFDPDHRDAPSLHRRGDRRHPRRAVGARPGLQHRIAARVRGARLPGGHART